MYSAWFNRNFIGFKFWPLDEVDRHLHSRASIAVLHCAHLPEAHGRRADLLVYSIQFYSILFDSIK